MDHRRYLIVAALLIAGTAEAAQNVKTNGAVGDAKVVFACSTTIGSGNVTCTDASFVVGDVGKVFWCVSQGVGVTNPLIAVTTITGRTSGTQITAGANANDTTSGAYCVYATQNDTTAFTTSFTNAYTGVDTTGATMAAPPQKIEIPCGTYAINGRIYNKQNAGPSAPLVGEGSSCTTLLLMPNITIPGDGSGVLIHTQGPGANMSGFAVYGLAMNYALNAGQDFVRLVAATSFTLRDVKITGVGSTTGGTSSAALALQDASHGILDGVFVQGSNNTSTMNACRFQVAGNLLVEGSKCSNHYRNLLVTGNHGRTPVTAGIVWVGGIVDECSGTVCTSLVDGEISFTNTTIYGNFATAMAVDATSVLWVDRGNVGQYLYTPTGLTLTIASGGRVYSSGTTWRQNGATKAITNSGTFVDMGGNDFLSCTAPSTCTRKTASYVMSGKQPVR